MTKFTDCNGKEWQLHLTFGHVEPLRKEAGLDLSKPGDERMMQVLYTDPVSLANALWVLVQKQAANKEEFFDILDTETMDRASDALLEELSTFIHRRLGPTVKAKMPELLAAIRKAQEKEIDGVLKSLSNDSQALPELIQET